jgi:rhodanese-related sulfurtransferase
VEEIIFTLRFVEPGIAPIVKSDSFDIMAVFPSSIKEEQMPKTKRRPNPPAGKPNAAVRTARLQPARRSSRPIWVILLLVVAVIAVGVLIVQAVSDASPWQYAEEISPLDAQSMINGGAVVVDVRTYEEFIAGHIEKSLYMPLDELPALLAALPRDRLIITVCRTGVRSTQAREIIQEAGYTQVTSLKGGIEAWLAANLPVVYGEPVRNN